VNLAPDSLKLAKNFVLGKVSDDYGLSKYRLFIIRGISGNYQTGTIAIKASIFQQFVFSFPGSLPVRGSYDYYFEVLTMTIHKYKSTRSAVSTIEFQLMKKSRMKCFNSKMTI
jgi:hypothetical protein